MPVTQISKKIIQKLQNKWTPETDWRGLLKKEKSVWRDFMNKRDSGRRVLIATSSGGHQAVTPVESLMAAALTLRGAEVHFLLCDGFLPACLMQTSADLVGDDQEFNESARLALCSRCQQEGLELYRPFGLPIHALSRWVEEDEKKRAAALAAVLGVDQMRAYTEEGMSLGEHAYAGALRFFARGDLEREPLGEIQLRRYFEAALLTRAAFERLFQAHRFDTVLFHHGIYVPQGIIGEAARHRRLRVVNWNVAYRKKSVIFSHEDTYHHTMMNEPVESWENIPWSDELDARLEHYLESRRTGEHDWIFFHQRSSENKDAAAAMLPVDTKKPMILLLTNVLWDAQLHYPANAFPDMMSWVFQTIDYFIARPDLQLVIRIHPAEIQGIPRSRQLVAREISTRYPKLPPHIHVVGPESPISTYDLAERADAALIYATKTGLELAARGIPVIVAGEGWIRNKGFTRDASNPGEYKGFLDELPIGKRMDAALRERARKYAYHFFFRRMVSLRNLVERKGLWPPLRVKVDSFSELAQGQDPGLDVLCGGLLEGNDFIFPAEVYARSD